MKIDAMHSDRLEDLLDALNKAKIEHEKLVSVWPDNQGYTAIFYY